jgi:hypothetical protein
MTLQSNSSVGWVQGNRPCVQTPVPPKINILPSNRFSEFFFSGHVLLHLHIWKFVLLGIGLFTHSCFFVWFEYVIPLPSDLPFPFLKTSESYWSYLISQKGFCLDVWEIASLWLIYSIFISMCLYGSLFWFCTWSWMSFLGV